MWNPDEDDKVIERKTPEEELERIRTEIMALRYRASKSVKNRLRVLSLIAEIRQYEISVRAQAAFHEGLADILAQSAEEIEKMSKFRVTG